MFHKILVPLDGSGLVAKILPQVIDLAKIHNSQVTLLQVYPAEGGEATPKVIREAVVQEAKRCELFLAQAAKALKALGIINFKIECVEGSPAREIIAYADKNGMDLIAMATHGKGKVTWVLGSVAQMVVSHATVPVLLFRVRLEITPPKTQKDSFWI
jgi:nucleotide-binding universal stress UspA family protein